MRICRDCDSKFELTEGELKFYKDKDFPLPLRCKSCRKKRKLQREEEKRSE